MNIYEGIKDVIKVVQQTDNIELFKKILDIQVQALDMQEEMFKLKQQNKDLKALSELTKKIERHSQPFVTIKDDTTLYCSHCWDSDKKTIQIHCKNDGTFRCPHCNSNGVYDKDKYDAIIRSIGNTVTPI